LKLEVEDIIYIIETVLETFQALLDIGIAFSDLKPANIVLVKYINR
jgi:RIO-like serine/threonine protein kinase